ncbi:MAG: AlkA N-terminal domain-containing protein, partial [Kangiellaceae bacterium]|nr:AlkA N-terminal domain-containing protein [Kangiellaceae bacterium]
PAWKGSETTFDRALQLIDQGALQTQTLEQLAERLGITLRYLRELFRKHLGTSPKTYALYQQCLFAKQLLHETSLPVTEIALAAGFNSIRRFNDCFKQQLAITPSEIRKQRQGNSSSITLTLNYRPPFAWQHMFEFLSARTINGLDWTAGKTYGRTINFQTTHGYFEITPIENKSALKLEVHLNQWQHLRFIVDKVRRLFDLDANSQAIDQQLAPLFPKNTLNHEGLRLPGIWSVFEAGIRAILGQQVSVKAAQNLVTQIVNELGQPLEVNNLTERRLFPTPLAIVESDLDFIKMPGTRKDTLRCFAQWAIEQSNDNQELGLSDISHNIDSILELKGIGPWTLDYIKMRGLSDPDIWLGGDLGIKNAMKQHDLNFDPDLAKPWRSYLTLQTWSYL